MAKTARTEAWILHVPDFSPIAAPIISTTTNTTTTTTKRKRAADSLTPRKAPRRALAPISHNMSTRRSPRKQSVRKADDGDYQMGGSSDGNGSGNDAVRTGNNEEALGNETVGYGDNDDDAATQTPRPTPRLSDHPPFSVAPPMQPTFDLRPQSPTRSSRRGYVRSSAASSAASSSSTAQPSSVASSSRSRASSPVKHFSDLLFADLPVRYLSGKDNMHLLPADIVDLNAKLFKAKRGTHIVPVQKRDMFTAAMASEGLSDEELNLMLQKDCTREQADIDEEWNAITKICQQTSRAQDLGLSEAGWNQEVHGRLFEEGFRHHTGVRHENVTSARPCADFLPTHAASGAVMKQKLVDFTVHLESDHDSDFYRRVRKLLELQPSSLQTMAPTLYPPVRFRPSVMSIETKSGSGSDGDARVQVGYWVIAQFNRLRTLLEARYGREAELIALPAHILIKIDVQTMSIMYAVQDGGSISVVVGPNFDLPTTARSGYACIAALRHLAEWAEHIYREWVANVLLE